jgi:methionyl aminopeptidase
MVFAIEPMVNAGAPQTITLSDGWTVKTADGKLSAHFEHTVLVGRDKPAILTLP